MKQIRLKALTRSRILWLVEQGIDNQEPARFNLPSHLQLQHRPPPAEVPGPHLPTDNLHLMKIPEIPKSMNYIGKWTNYRSRFPSQEVMVATLPAKQERTADSTIAAPAFPTYQKHHLGGPRRTIENRFQSANINSSFSPPNAF
jgi:hypothetical protein